MKKTIASIVMSILSCLLLFANGVKDTGSGKLVFWDKSEYTEIKFCPKGVTTQEDS